MVKLVYITNIPLVVEKVKVPERLVYDKLPQYFNGLSSWPKSCNLRCRNCGCNSKRYPLFIPLNKSENGYLRGASPYYCSPNCGGMAILMLTNEYERERKMELFCSLISEIIGERFGAFNFRCNADNLERFGGNMCDEEFQHEITHRDEVLFRKLYYSPNDMYLECARSST